MRVIRQWGAALSGLAVLAVATLAAPARAQTQALDFTGGALFGNTEDTAMFGWSFTTSVPVVVTQLGLFDAGNNGLVNSHQLGLWDNGGTLLTSATIASGLSGTAVASASGSGAFRYVDTTTVPLAPGTYVVGALYAVADQDQYIGNASSATMAAGFTFVAARATVSGFGFPTGTVTGTGNFGPNLRFTAVTAAPEPGSLALILVGVTAGLVRRKKR